MNNEPFLKPRLSGSRFNGGVIPLEVLADFAVLEEMFVEVAKWKYREAFPNRKRVPTGFLDGVSLNLTGIEEGSAIGVIKLVIAATTFLGAQPQIYLDEAKSAILGAIGAAEVNESIDKFLPPKFLGYFNRFGKNLEDGEAIHFAGDLGKAPVRLTKDIRRRLVLASSEDRVADEVIVHGLIPEVNQQTKTFQIRLLDGSKVIAPITPQHYDTVIEAFTGYRHGQKVRVRASGQFSRSNRLQVIDSVGHITLLDPLDIMCRAEELKLLKHGWLNGKGLPLTHDRLDWIVAQFASHYSSDLPQPYLYPTTEGGVRAEWSIGSHELSLDVNLSTRVGFWHALNLSDDAEDSQMVSMDEAIGWEILAKRIRSFTETSQ